MKWYRHLYVSEGARGKKFEIIWNVKHGAGQLNVYLVTLAANEDNLLDFFHSSMLLQPALRKRCPLIVGIASGETEAVQMAADIVTEVYNRTGSFKVRDYILGKEENKESK